MDARDPLNIIGQTIAEKYRVLSLVGEGGFSAVYRAQHTIWKKPVAMKFFAGLATAPDDQRDELYASFIQEGALLTELCGHTPNIVQARDIGTFTARDGRWLPYMVLEWLEGAALDEVLDQERQRADTPWSLFEAIRLLGPAARALDIAHRRGIAHRDIKPANLFVLGLPRQAGAVMKILDFGVAKIMSDVTLSAARAKTGWGFTSFTPQYGAPEQFSRSVGATGPWTDVFALALVTVEMLSGYPPLVGDDVTQLAYAATNPRSRPTPRALGVVVPDAVEEVFARALDVEPSRRYERVGSFWSELELAAGMPITELMAPTVKPLDAELSTGRIEKTDAVPGTPASWYRSAPMTPSERALPTVPAGRTAKRYLGLAVGGGIALLGAVIFALHGRESPPASRAPASPAESVAKQTAASLAAAPTVAVPKPTCPPRMATIPAGQFFMGSDEKDAPDDQKPAHNVALDSFCIDLYEVTAQEYKACSDVGKCRRAPTNVDWPGITEVDRRRYNALCNTSAPERQDHPVNCVTWDMATHYCANVDKRLPTEAEWEYATRGPDGRIYPWGDEDPTSRHLNACGKECVAWGKANGVELRALYAEDDGYPVTAPVGGFPAGRSRFGPFDVVGNVWEWTATWYGLYDAEPARNPTGPAGGERRVIRGGAWNGGYPTWLHPSHRYGQDPKARSHGIGFRCAKPLAERG